MLYISVRSGLEIVISNKLIIKEIIVFFIDTNYYFRPARIGTLIEIVLNS